MTNAPLYNLASQIDATETFFYKNAMLAASFGIAVVPCQPREKACKLKDWPALATTDETQIRQWAQQNRDYSVAYVAFAKMNVPCFLEFDVADGMRN